MRLIYTGIAPQETPDHFLVTLPLADKATLEDAKETITIILVTETENAKPNLVELRVATLNLAQAAIEKTITALRA